VRSWSRFRYPRIVGNRWDETWHRLREWTNGQGPSERLAAQILLGDGYESIDPSHPLGGRDGLKDALCQKDGKRWVMAAYFPRGQQPFSAINKKLADDAVGVALNGAYGLAFVTNQEVLLAEREVLAAAAGVPLELLHLERVTAILDRPEMSQVRKQFLSIDDDAPMVILGGAGGNAPGAGGGGGAAIGDGRGGEGGRGGDINLDGQPGVHYGAGGGGGGAMGPFAVGGEGGGGGEIVHAVLQTEPGRTYDVHIGRGGGRALPGLDGEDGEDTTFGDLLVAKGGKGGKTGYSTPATRAACRADVENGLRVTVLLAEVVHLRNGLAYLLGGGWEHVKRPTVPFDDMWPALLTVDFGHLGRDVGLELFAEVRDPAQRVVLREPLVVHVGQARAIVRPNLVVALRFTIWTFGIWTVAVTSGDIELAAIAIAVELGS
jgi:hypothetical protein